MRQILEQIITGIGRAGPSTGATAVYAPDARGGGGSIGRGTTRRVPHLRVRAAVRAAFFVGFVLDLAALVLPAAVMAAATWPNSTDPTYTGPGSSPITESGCLATLGTQSGCYFKTSDGGTFIVPLPAGFVAEFPDGTQPDAVDVMKAMLSQKNMLNLSAIPSAATISPAYAAKLATVGVTPAQFLAWLYVNVPASERPPWVQGSTNAPQPAPQQNQQPPAQPAQQPTNPAPKPAYPTPVPAQTSTGTGGQASGQPSIGSQPAVDTGSASSAPSTAPSGSVGQGGAASEGGSPPAASDVTPPAVGQVTPHPVACPPGYSELNTPNGGRCAPDAALGVKPLPTWWQAHPWARDMLVALAAVVVMLGVVAGVRRWRRRPAPSWR